MVRVLDRLSEVRGVPMVTVVDNSPESCRPSAGRGAYAHGVTLRFIRPGKPIVGSFSGKCRDECLNEHWFQSVAEALTVIEIWRRDYNEVRPHCGLQRPARYLCDRSIASRTHTIRVADTGGAGQSGS